MRILFDSKDERFKRPFGCVHTEENFQLSVHIPKTVKTKAVMAIFENDNGLYCEYPLECCGKKEEYEIYSGGITIDHAGLYFYYFMIFTQESSFRLFKQNYSDTNMEEGEKWQLSCIARSFRTPDSFKGNVMYQIFPDRFAKEGECDLSGKLMPFSLHKSVSECPDFLPDKSGEVHNNDFYGGNLRGIRGKLEYISSLGVKSIYLNPIFKAYSNHRYDTFDYKEIDPMLGTYEDFCTLCKSASGYGIGIILDGVFSHTGIRSRYFEDAVKNPQSPFRSWYKFKKYPSDYTCWWGIRNLPEIEEMTQSYLDYIIRDEESVAAYWLRAGAAGFRLDVADELPDEFIYLLRRRVKEINPQAVVIGEVWEDASNKISYGKRRKYFVNSELDSVMNYPFANAIMDFAGGIIDAQKFSEIVLTIAENYPRQSLQCLMNCLSTHDTERAISRLSGVFPQTRQQRAEYKMDASQYRDAVQKLRTAAFLQYILPGNPCIYYGDEIGMQGYEDPFNRKFFTWNEIDRELLLFYRKLGEMKNKYKQLCTEDLRIIYDKNDTVIIKRGNLSARVCRNEKITACPEDMLTLSG